MLFRSVLSAECIPAEPGALRLLSRAARGSMRDALSLLDRLISTGTQWLFGYRLASLFPAPSGGSSSFTAPVISRLATVPYSASVADNHGGGATGQQYVTVSPDPALNGAPTGGLSLSANTIPVGGTVTVNYAPIDPESGPVAWDVWAAGYGGANGWCCYSGSGVGITKTGEVRPRSIRLLPLLQCIRSLRILRLDRCHCGLCSYHRV